MVSHLCFIYVLVGYKLGILEYCELIGLFIIIIISSILFQNSVLLQDLNEAMAQVLLLCSVD